MIISHRNKFIFIKTEKTAGTSIEIALSKYCGPEDVITPFSAEDEITRKELGYRGPQNYAIPFRRYTTGDFLKYILTNRRPVFYNHMRASRIVKYIDRDIWDSYFKFCVERNPWDKAVSLYYYRYRSEPRPTMSEFIRSRRLRRMRGFKLYTLDSEIAVDKVFKYENLDQAMEEIRDRVGLQDTPVLPRAKGAYRKDRNNYRDILSEEDRAEIARMFAREIEYFGYEW